MPSPGINSTTTATGPEALTTPFVPPEGCTDQFGTTSFVDSYYWNNFSTTTVTYFTSDEVSSCLPSGWDQVQSESFHYSPAVCPSGWTAYGVGPSLTAVGSPVTATKTITIASCCSSGFTPSYESGVPNPSASTAACFEDVPSTITPKFPPNSLRIHNAWTIAWESSDRATLSPTPPDFRNCIDTLVLPTWVPGTTVDPSEISCPDTSYTSSRLDGGWSPSQTRGMWFVMVGLPIIGFLLLVTCGILCVRRTRRSRAAGIARAQHFKEQVEERRRQEAAGQATSTETAPVEEGGK